MQNRELPPMAGGSAEVHPREVICIEAKKVFDFCFQEQRIERVFENLTNSHGEKVIVECRIDTQNVRCREVERKPADDKKGKFIICLAIEVPVRLIIGTDVVERKLTFLKQVVLFAPKGTEVQCEVTGNCCCLFDKEQDHISCVFDLCVVISAKATVRILVPTLGFCAPKECSGIVTGCPPLIPHDCPTDC